VTLVLVMAFAALVWFTVFTAAARAGTDPSTPSTDSTVTTEAPTTTQASTTVTTQRPSTTVTTSAPRPTQTTVRPSTTSTEATTESLAPTTETSAPEIVTDPTLPRRTDLSSDSGLSTDAKLAMVVGGLVAVGLLIGLLTFLYWRHTRPQRYLTALDALADVEQKVPKDGEQVPTAADKTVPAGVGAATGAAPAAGDATATQAFRIIDPSPTSADAPTPPIGTPRVDPPPSTASPDEPTTITTIEDLKSARPPAED
jgi:cytoskeletal protein RodZ